VLSCYLFVSLHLNRLVVIPIGWGGGSRSTGSRSESSQNGNFLTRWRKCVFASLSPSPTSQTASPSLFASYWSFTRIRKALLSELRDDTRSATVRVPLMQPLFVKMGRIALERRGEESGGVEGCEYRLVVNMMLTSSCGRDAKSWDAQESIRVASAWNVSEDALNEALLFNHNSEQLKGVFGKERYVHLVNNGTHREMMNPSGGDLSQQPPHNEHGDLLHDEDEEDELHAAFENPLTHSSPTNFSTIDYETDWVHESALKCFPLMERVVRRSASGKLKLQRPRSQPTSARRRRNQGVVESRDPAEEDNISRDTAEGGDMELQEMTQRPNVDDDRSSNDDWHSLKHIKVPLVIYCELIKKHNASHDLQQWDSEANRAYFIVEFSVDKSSTTNSQSTSAANSSTTALSSTFAPRLYKALYQNEQNELFTVNEVYTSEDDDCVICLSEEPSVILLPCRHQCVCYDCFSQIDKCPVCRSMVQHYIFSAKNDKDELVDDSTTMV